jgi:cell wall-associated NlpC family hydrolase
MLTLTDEQRAIILAEADTWKGTPYRGWSAVKGGGVDCGQLIYAVYRACGLVPAVELPKDYSLQVAQHRASTEYLSFVDQFCREIPEEEARPADIVLYKLGLGYSHGGIVVEWPRKIVQAEARHGFCAGHGIKTPAFRGHERCFRTLRPEYCGGGF